MLLKQKKLIEKFKECPNHKPQQTPGTEKKKKKIKH